MTDRRLGEPAVQAIAVTAGYEWPEGFHVVLSYRRSGDENWRQDFGHDLSSQELSDWLCSTLGDLLF